MEIIKNITEVSDVYFNDDKWNTYDGYCIETDSRQLYFVKIMDNVVAKIGAIYLVKTILEALLAVN